MQIHVVQSGDSLYSIANMYTITPDVITAANQIEADQTLVVGQTLVIPIQGSYYWVKPRDNLYSIAQKFGLNFNALSQINQWPIERPLPVGFRLYIPPQPKRMGTFKAYIEPRDGVSEVLKNAAREAAPYLTYIAPYSFQVNEGGSLTPPSLDDLGSIAAEDGALLMMVISNLSGAQFSPEIASNIFYNKELQDTFINNIVLTAKQLGFSHIVFNFELIRAEDREAYNQFLRNATKVLHEEGFLVSTTLAPKTSAEQTGLWNVAHDYKAHGEIVDYVFIMTYDWGNWAGPPMPVSPINEVRKVLEYALSEIPAHKIIMGQNLYGYDWTLPYEPGGEFAKALSPQGAINLARERNEAIQFDDVAQAPFFKYIDDLGNEHEVWFEDARSIQAKFNLIKELNLAGMGYWKLGLSFPQNWLLLGDNFNVSKLM
ncbi:glycoside hydrolase family 18 protein [Chengkuizengella axinellae]|uniref:Glycoside hydrolase family 18 protein n=1 Tax=Chengkuizengella axinellae TaxID=3064388 RepID=A0ABT9J1R9_9BACL|nr:glycoside hydrolase family 18 protein [Chengkuizengella sp. 2205SS18-9]MDP5275557.1 glycoside hydrolase family 18 protein [Chengkuizengella sp. 2205SS18-9]